MTGYPSKFEGFCSYAGSAADPPVVCAESLRLGGPRGARRGGGRREEASEEEEKEEEEEEEEEEEKEEEEDQLAGQSNRQRSSSAEDPFGTPAPVPGRSQKATN